MKLAYQFSRHEIHLCDISVFQTLFGMDRLKETLKQKSNFGNYLIGSVAIKFEQDERQLWPYEDEAIRKLCKRLFEETPAAFLDEPPPGAMSSLFLCTLSDVTKVLVIEDADRVNFRADEEATKAHGMVFQEKIIQVAEQLGMEWQYYMPHCAKVRVPLHG